MPKGKYTRKLRGINSIQRSFNKNTLLELKDACGANEIDSLTEVMRKSANLIYKLQAERVNMDFFKEIKDKTWIGTISP